MEVARILDSCIETSEKPSTQNLGADLGALHQYWVSLCNGKRMPTWQSWDWLQVPSNIIAWCSVVDKHSNDYIFRFWGTARTELHGKDYTGHSVSQVEPKIAAAKAVSEYDAVTTSGEPLFIIRSGLGAASDRVYKILRLPFGNGQSVEQILSAGTCFDDDMPTSKTLLSYFPNATPLR